MFNGVGLLWLRASCQFVSQPGDVELTAVPGYQLPDYIPCILDGSTYTKVGWEQETTNRKPHIMSLNRQFYAKYNGSYVFKEPQNSTLDYSISIREVQHTVARMRCFVMNPHLQFSHSSWSNITLTGMSDANYVFPLHKIMTQTLNSDVDNLAVTFKC